MAAMARPRRLLAAALLAAALPALPGAARGGDAEAHVLEPAPATPEPDGESGRAIYERFLGQRLRESRQELRVVSRDPGGSAQTTRFTISSKDLRGEDDAPTDGILAKMLIEVSEPFDLRHTAYLIIAKEPGPDDEFIYQPSQRSVKRADLKNTSLLGTDYTFNDVAYQKIDDAEYARLADEVVDGKPVYVVEVNVHDDVQVAFPRTILYLEQETLVPLRMRYWDPYGVEIKEMTAPASSVRSFDGTWVATESTMRDLRQGTTSTLLVDDLDPHPDFPKKTFSLGTLYKGR